MKKKTRKPTLADVVKAAHKAGLKVTQSLRPNMPLRFPSDDPKVSALLDECERCNEIGCGWMESRHANPVAAQKAFEMAWAHSLSASWLRCYLKGELEKKP